MRTLARLIAGLILALCGPLAGAVDDNEPGQAAVDPDLEAGRAAVKAWRWDTAIERLQRAVKKDANNADAHNLLGYSYRHVNRFDESLRHYREALRLDPRHRGAHEYIGQAYLLRGEHAKAEEHLAALENICGLRCEEYRDLKRAIEAAKKK